MAGRDWRVNINVVATGQAAFERVDIEVHGADDSADAPALARLTGFLGAN